MQRDGMREERVVVEQKAAAGLTQAIQGGYFKTHGAISIGARLTYPRPGSFFFFLFSRRNICHSQGARFTPDMAAREITLRSPHVCGLHSAAFSMHLSFFLAVIVFPGAPSLLLVGDGVKGGCGAGRHELHLSLAAGFVSFLGILGGLATSFVAWASPDCTTFSYTGVHWGVVLPFAGRAAWGLGHPDGERLIRALAQLHNVRGGQLIWEPLASLPTS